MARIKPVKPGRNTEKAGIKLTGTATPGGADPVTNDIESRQTRKLATNHNESRQTRKLSANHNESLACR